MFPGTYLSSPCIVGLIWESLIPSDNFLFSFSRQYSIPGKNQDDSYICLRMPGRVGTAFIWGVGSFRYVYAML